MTSPDLPVRVTRNSADIDALYEILDKIKEAQEGQRASLTRVASTQMFQGGRLNQIDGELAAINARLAEQGSTLAEHGVTLASHGVMLADHGARLDSIDGKLSEMDGKLSEILDLIRKGR